jgi:hypothetical protein
MMAKLCRATFCKAESVSSAPLQLFHMDLAGPFRLLRQRTAGGYFWH